MTGAFVFPEVMVGIAEASATRRSTPRYTRQSECSTVAADRGRPRVSKPPEPVGPDAANSPRCVVPLDLHSNADIPLSRHCLMLVS